MARTSYFVLVLVLLAALVVSSSATRCHGSKGNSNSNVVDATIKNGRRRLSSAPITLKTTTLNKKSGGAHSSFDGVAEPVRESGYFKVGDLWKRKRERGERKRAMEEEMRGNKEREGMDSFRPAWTKRKKKSSTSTTTTKKNTQNNDSSTAPTTLTCSSCTSSPGRRRRRPTR